jgi:hypothetical protein
MKEEDIAIALKGFLDSRYAFKMSDDKLLKWAQDIGWNKGDLTWLDYLKEHNPGMVFWPDLSYDGWIVYTKENPVLFQLKYSEYL